MGAVVLLGYVKIAMTVFELGCHQNLARVGTRTDLEASSRRSGSELLKAGFSTTYHICITRPSSYTLDMFAFMGTVAGLQTRSRIWTWRKGTRLPIRLGRTDLQLASAG